MTCVVEKANYKSITFFHPSIYLCFFSCLWPQWRDSRPGAGAEVDVFQEWLLLTNRYKLFEHYHHFLDEIDSSKPLDWIVRYAALSGRSNSEAMNKQDNV